MMNQAKGQMRQAIGDGGEDRRDAENLQVPQQHLQGLYIALGLAGMEFCGESP